MTKFQCFVYRLFSGFIIISMIMSCDNQTQKEKTIDKIDISGHWTVKLDSLSIGENEKWFETSMEGTKIDLPGTLDDAQIGKKDTLKPALNNYILSNLARKYAYIGKAWYQRSITIPENWDGKEISMSLERIMWRSTVYIDNKKIGSQESLIGSHNFNLTKSLTTGKHTLTILIDNSNIYPNINVKGDKYPLKVNQEMAHAYTNHTQIKWNGILGKMQITATPPQAPKNLQIYPNLKDNSITVTFQQPEGKTATIGFEIKDVDDNIIFSETLDTKDVGNQKQFTITKPEGVKNWSEFTPQIYKAVLKSQSTRLEANFGFREIQSNNSNLELNNKRIFLRGNLECSIFPLTGHPPMQVNDWDKLYKKAKNYGLNHLRFHSYCPPKAAFEAADKNGIYLQVELPHWSLTVGESQEATEFLKKEAQKMLKDYGNHPSFILMSLGNELQGDMNLLNNMTKTLKEKDKRHLYATTTFSFQKPSGTRPEKEDEVFISQWTEKGWLRGQGVFNDYPPRFDQDFSTASKDIKMPLISHEIGQYSVYPDMKEIEKYTGVLSPLNFIAVKNDLEKKNLLPLANDFTMASGKLAALLYKEEIERALKTPYFDGFQLLQLQDFPGQGTALVGLLNAFWESKGVIDGKEFRRFNSPVVPIARFKKAVYESGEKLECAIEIAQFLDSKSTQNIKARVLDKDKKLIKETRLTNVDLEIGLNKNLGKLEIPINVKEASQWTLEISVEDTPYINSWPIWVYPKTKEKRSGNILVTPSFSAAIKGLSKGQLVFLNPSIEKIKGIEGRFVPVFWSPVHFPDQPGTMGLLIDKNHSALSQFPTETFTQWQWWDLCKKSKSVEMKNLKIKPIVRVIDNFVTNKNLTNLFEAKVGKGKLIFSSIDLMSNLDKRPVARQLKNSVLEYMASSGFNPDQPLTKDDILKLKNK